MGESINPSMKLGDTEEIYAHTYTIHSSYVLFMLPMPRGGRDLAGFRTSTDTDIPFCYEFVRRHMNLLTVYSHHTILSTVN